MKIKYSLFKTIATFAIIWLTQTNLYSQLDIAPPSIVLSSELRSTTMLVRNTGNDETEYEITSYFGYPATDSSGTLFTKLDSGEIASAHSLQPYLKFFPHHLKLRAGGEQLIKYVVLPRSNMLNGAYWTRVSIKSMPVSKPIETEMNGDSIALQYNMSLERITSAVYLNGNYDIGVAVGDINLKIDSVLKVFISLGSGDVSPFWGKATIRIEDEQGGVLDEKYEMIAVYYNMNRKFDFDKSKLKQGGRYFVRILINADRDEIPKKYHDHFVSIDKRKEFIVP